MHFPQVETHDLEGEPRLVPDELVGELRIVIVAFQRWHTGLIDTWLPVLGELTRPATSSGTPKGGLQMRPLSVSHSS